MSILVVEDDDGVRESLADILTEEGYAVHGAPDGYAALEWLKTNLPSLILLDLMMPRMGGVEFAARVRADARLAKTPIIVLSARTDVREQALRADAVDWLAKPMSFEELLHVVQNRAITVVGEVPHAVS